MIQTKLKKLRVSGFRSFVEEQEILFPESGLVLVRGQNFDSQGSSGSGKTTVLLAIQYAIGICPFPATTLQSWQTEDRIFVELTLTTKDGEVVVTRSPKLSLSVNGESVKGSAAMLETELQRILGLSPDLLEALTYRRQSSRGQFLAKGDTDKKAFLTELLGLERFEKAAETSQKLISDLEPKLQAALEERNRCLSDPGCVLPGPVQLMSLDKANADVTEAETEAARLRSQIDKLENELRVREGQIRAESASAFDSFRPQISTLEQQLQTAKSAPVLQPDHTEYARLKSEYERIGSVINNLKFEDESRWSVARKNAQELNLVLTNLKVAQSSIDRIKATGLQKMQQIQDLTNNTCPTCKQIWVKAQEQKALLEAEVVQLAEALQKAVADTAQIPEIEKRLMILRERVVDPEIEIQSGSQRSLMMMMTVEKSKADGFVQNQEAEKRLLCSEIQTQLSKIKAEAQNAVSAHEASGYETLLSLRNQLSVLNQNWGDAVNALGMHKTARQNTEAQNAVILAKAEADKRAYEQARQRLAKAQERVVVAEKDLAQERDFLALVGKEGFLSCIFDEILYEIAQEANTIINGIPNVAHVNIAFRSETSTQKGALKKSIVPVVHIGGHEAPLHAGCSGGMFSAIELAVDLGVAEVIRRRTGSVPAWMVLDEAFEGLGVREKEGCLEILSKYALDKLVLIVDHSSETKASFTQTIDVEYRNGRSEIR